jgi:HNH endonuclease
MAISDSTSRKRCSKCGNEYPATSIYFNVDKRDPSGFRNPCKACKGVKNQIRECAPVDIGIPNAVGIQLSKGCIAIVDERDADLARRYWHVTTEKGKPCYACGNTPLGSRSTAKVYLHQIIMERCVGRLLNSEEQVDHRNGNKLDCRRENLRIASHAQNRWNTGHHNSSGLKGVYLHKRSGLWQASIRVNGKKHHLGYFRTPQEAHEAYKKAALELHGEFARFE